MNLKAVILSVGTLYRLAKLQQNPMVGGSTKVTNHTVGYIYYKGSATDSTKIVKSGIGCQQDIT